MKGYLKSLDGVFQLGQRVTTIGREGCDLIIQAVDIDYRHAVIEFNEREGTFALQDLNSTHGTFVNDVQARSAAVPLSPGSTVRFGHPGVLFTFIVDFQKETSICLPLEKRPNYLAAHPVPPQIVYKDGLPQLRSAVIPDGFNESKRETDPEEQPQWIIGPGESYEEACEEALSNEEENLELVVQCLRDEVKRLLVFESECMFKDDLIDQLKDEVAYLQLKLRQFEVGSLEITGQEQLNSAASIKMLQLDTKTLKTEEQEQNATKIYRMPSLIVAPPVPPVPSLHSSQLLLTQISQYSSAAAAEEEPKAGPPSDTSVPPEQGIDDLRKELNLARGLLFRTQENFASKDATISKLSKEADNLRQEVAEKDQIIAALREAMLESSEETGREEETVQRGKELLLLQKKLKSSSMQQAEQTVLLESLKNELQSSKKSAAMDRLALRKLQTENEQNKVKILDLERQERLARIETEQLNVRLEKFRSRLIQNVYSQPNAKVPNSKITDDDLLLAVNKCSAVAGSDSPNKSLLNTPSAELLATKSGSSTGVRAERTAKK